MLLDPVQHRPRKDSDRGSDALEGLDDRPFLRDQLEQVRVEGVSSFDAASKPRESAAGSELAVYLRDPSVICRGVEGIRDSVRGGANISSGKQAPLDNLCEVGWLRDGHRLAISLQAGGPIIPEFLEPRGETRPDFVAAESHLHKGQPPAGISNTFPNPQEEL